MKVIKPGMNTQRNTNGTKTAIGYVRVSTQEQASDGVSLDAQRDKLRAYCKVNGIRLIDIKADEGYSGSTLERPGLQAALQLIRRGRAHARYWQTKMMIFGAPLHETQARARRRWIFAASFVVAMHVGSACFALIAWPSSELSEDFGAPMIVELSAEPSAADSEATANATGDPAESAPETPQVNESRSAALDPDQVAAYALGVWGLPDALIEAVGCHRHPARVAHGDTALVLAVHVAGAVVHAAPGARPPIDAAFVERCGRAAELPAWIALAERLRDEAG